MRRRVEKDPKIWREFRYGWELRNVSTSGILWNINKDPRGIEGGRRVSSYLFRMSKTLFGSFRIRWPSEASISTSDSCTRLMPASRTAFPLNVTTYFLIAPVTRSLFLRNRKTIFCFDLKNRGVSNPLLSVYCVESYNSLSGPSRKKLSCTAADVCGPNSETIALCAFS